MLHCEFCNRQFETVKNRKRANSHPIRFCTTRCRDKWWQAERSKEEKVPKKKLFHFSNPW